MFETQLSKSESDGPKSASDGEVADAGVASGLFPPAYEPHGVKLLYAGEPIELTPDQEEVASLYAALLDTDYVHNEVFNPNFFKDFRAVLSSTPDHDLVTQLDLCDFSLIHDHLAQQRKAKHQALTERQARKAKLQMLKQLHSTALVDGEPAPIGNWQIEPPGLFRGRGQHPQAGCLKPRIQPEAITLNLGQEAEPPQLSGALEGHRWGAVEHDQSATWLAKWRDHVTAADKYIFLSTTAVSMQARDRERFDAARQLDIEAIREAYMEDLNSDDERLWQCATALWLIDHAGLRVGNESKEAEHERVGCCSLHVKHVRCEEPDTVHFDFVGADSLRYRNAIEVPLLVFAKLKQLVHGNPAKEITDNVFDRLSAADLTKRLEELTPGLTSKLLRVFNRSWLLHHELSKPLPPSALSTEAKLARYNEANRRVAIHAHLPSRGLSLGSATATLYMDPRITVAWAKRHDVPIEKIWTKCLREKVAWALAESASFDWAK